MAHTSYEGIIVLKEYQFVAVVRPQMLALNHLFHATNSGFLQTLIRKIGMYLLDLITFFDISRYPKHMGLQMKIMEGKLRTVDMILEVHDGKNWLWETQEICKKL